ncbi:hypothetical protein SAMN03159496_06303 [Rhizobium sp. NFR07]|nr:hypothetical protein SAMN03159496_06303 [Rhizobium sp. NFR07]
MRTVYSDKPVDCDGRLIFGPTEAHKSMMGTSWVTIRDRPFAAAANSSNNALNGRASPTSRVIIGNRPGIPAPYSIAA